MFGHERHEGSLEHLQRQWDDEERAAEMPSVRSGMHAKPEHDRAAVESVERKPRFVKGDAVCVRRSSGVVEDGWTVHEIFMNGYYRVAKDTGEKDVLTKFVPWDELEQLNPPE